MVYTSSMIRVLKFMLMVMGGVFILQVVVLGYLVVADPFQIRPLVQLLWQSQKAHSLPLASPTTVPSGVEAGAATTVAPDTAPTATPSMTAAQQEALNSAGIDPSTITPAQLNCFTSVLGASRMAEIKAGAVPTAAEFFSVRSCL